MNISIFGLGYVGCVSLGCLAQNGHHVTGVDVSPIKVGQINSGRATIVEKDIDQIIAEQFAAGRIKATTDYRSAILSTDLSIIAVGTPSTPQGHLNLSYIFKVADHFGEVLAEKEGFHVIAIRSTVMPGTCDQIATRIETITGKVRNVDFAVISNPEFLREGTAVSDYFNPPLTLIGTESERAAAVARSLYEKLPAKIIVADTKTAEIMKYVNNTFHALKISFANEVGNICSALNIDSHEVMDIFCQDTQLNISKYYFKPGFAYGGSCLPKDLKGLQTLAHDLYVQVPVINNIHRTNEIQMQRALAVLMQHAHRNIGFLGIGFKAGTDDLRNSPAVELAEALLGKGCNLKIYDKNVHHSKLTGTNKEYIDRHIPHLSCLMVADDIELAEWSDVLVVATKETGFVTLLENVSGKTVVDLVRIQADLNASNNYIGINWSYDAVGTYA
ncbi:nucleotide sugar dehydrogenase [Fibrivirga algicola]|uniref:UDP-glucose 6-dehydrogenase n=1 Tax=Fibrivirga algicola TaxID=2950420 RepID=A0ABX0QNW5_9BACT|nr:nucleotide sugar dehydrogenase [Fibrivirga algicola]ARK12559.1 GDP-mannose dehydrogenase [Fibrella sp. ES10-3-2-2]NID12288.1 UDP-glucose/GDP-mannose dehydrogenase family protein [Fibrivirga algicola]